MQKANFTFSQPDTGFTVAFHIRESCAPSAAKRLLRKAIVNRARTIRTDFGAFAARALAFAFSGFGGALRNPVSLISLADYPSARWSYEIENGEMPRMRIFEYLDSGKLRLHYEGGLFRWIGRLRAGDFFHTKHPYGEFAPPAKAKRIKRVADVRDAPDAREQGDPDIPGLRVFSKDEALKRTTRKRS